MNPVTGTGSGNGLTLNDPGTINITALGYALKITGDDSGTLTSGCGGGMGNNGKLTITVGTQQQVIREPYGPSRPAFFGPFTTSGDISYTIELKDSQCNDQVTGTVHVP